MITSTPHHPEFAGALLAPGSPAPGGLLVDREDEAERRFAVHRNTFVVSLIDALADSFPVTQALVGSDFFRAMARERVLGDPPCSPVLTEYAHGFPDFIAGFVPAATLPYLADVARIEALRIQAYHAADAVPIAHARFVDLLADPRRLGGATMQLHPACAWFRSQHAALSLWDAHQGLAEMGEAKLESIDVEAPEDVLITRPHLDVVTEVLPPGAIEWLDALRLGHTLGEARQHAHDAVHDVDDSALFGLLIRQGLAIELDNHTEN